VRRQSLCARAAAGLSSVTWASPAPLHLSLIYARAERPRLERSIVRWRASPRTDATSSSGLRWHSAWHVTLPGL
jgi:hypothetical protein